MSKQRPNTESIANELEGASLFFAKPNTTPPAQVPASVSHVQPKDTKTQPLHKRSRNERPNVRTDDAPNERPTERPVEPTIERIKVRHSFDIFADQLRDLQTLQWQAVQVGKRKPTLGVMIQQGIDL